MSADFYVYLLFEREYFFLETYPRGGPYFVLRVFLSFLFHSRQQGYQVLPHQQV